jgi:hypothetical protein
MENIMNTNESTEDITAESETDTAQQTEENKSETTSGVYFQEIPVDKPIIVNMSAGLNGTGGLP